MYFRRIRVLRIPASHTGPGWSSFEDSFGLFPPGLTPILRRRSAISVIAGSGWPYTPCHVLEVVPFFRIRRRPLHCLADLRL